MTSTNVYGQPVGSALEGWAPRERPTGGVLTGRYCRLERLDGAVHGPALVAAHRGDDGAQWTYLPIGPFDDERDLRAWIDDAAGHDDPLHYAVIDAATGTAVGSLALLRQDPGNGVVEVGWVTYSPLLRRTRASTEAQYLLMCHVFDDLGYRRYEWKCDALNAPSRAAAARLGFTYEGTFRQAVVYKGRSRDTAWFSLLDHEWPQVRAGFEAWLDPTNFDAEGAQRTPLEVRGSAERR
ncbi:GNAT family N-acetyltransferase [Brevibacterium litoralis]|uniref:GNAT family N-acetyltransferase n=1 Tax=Brevibacterium litoralis TaxID=3138935 RepID=UPI0032F02281